jgi:hypothetical protein
MRWVGHVARTGGMGNCKKSRLENLKKNNSLEELVVDGEVISE